MIAVASLALPFAPARAEPAAAAEIWFCGRQPVQWRAGPAAARLTVGAEPQDLVPGEAAGVWVGDQDERTRWQLAPGAGQARLLWRGVALAPCTPAGRPALPYVAQGQPAGAWLRLDEDGASWAWQGQEGRMAALPGPVAIPGGWRYGLEAGGRRWRVDVMARPCRQGGDGGPAPHTVSVWPDLGAGSPAPATPVWQGCGGDPAANLLSVGWQATLLRGTPPVAGHPIVLRFRADGGFEGHTGCNAFAGAFTLSAAGLRIGQWRRAQRACPDPALQRQEAELAALLQGVRGFDLDDDGSLVLFSTAGTLKAMAQTPWSPAAVAAWPGG